MQDNRFDIKNNAQVIKAMINKAMRKTAPQAASVTSPRNYYGDGYPPSGGSGFVNPMTTIGDIIYASETDTPADAVRLGIGTEGHVLTVASGVPVWAAGGGASNIEDGTVTGQMAYWDNVAGEWKHTEVTEMFWDDTAKGLGIGKDRVPASRR